MCGIAGIVSERPVREAEPALRRMLTAMRHRGPDDEGMTNFESRIANRQFRASGKSEIWLGMRRLSIIDLPGGKQPMFNEDGSVVVVFDGEIYNFQELRAELERRSHRFHTHSDTEVIVHAYEEWGSECVSYFRGMFAMAIADGRSFSSTLLLARDRLGIKPLYYYAGEGGFVFASEVRALLASGLVPCRLGLKGLYSYLLFGSVQEPLTFIKGVYSLPPGYQMAWKMENGERTSELERYWDFPDEAKERRSRGAEEQEELKRLLEEAIRLRLIADVPLGAFLSGGIDSGAVVALMSRSSKEVKTFTIAFEEPEFNEAPVARRTAARFCTEHTEVRVSRAQVLEELPQALGAMDQPTMDGINTYYVSRAAKEAGLTVALSGLGGDELFAGYSTFRTVPCMMRLQGILRPLPKPVRRAVANLLNADTFSLFPSHALHKLGALIAEDIQFVHPYFLARALFTPEQVSTLLTSDARRHLTDSSPWHRRVADTLAHAQIYDVVNAVSYLESTHYLVSTLLRDTDQMSMAHSLEVRVPLIDHELVEFIMRLPGNCKIQDLKSAIRNPTPKPLLVNALNGALPDEVVHRRKTTFTFPWECWLRGPLQEEVAVTLSRVPPTLEGIIDPAAVWAVWQAFLDGHTSWSRPWALNVLFKWVEQHIARRV